MRLSSIALLAGLVLPALAASPAGAAGVTLHALMEDIPETRIIEAMLPEFERETGIRVEFQKLAYAEMHDKLVAQLVGGESAYSLLEVDFLWAGEFPEAGWLAPLQPYVDRTGFDLQPFIPAMLDLVGRHRGELFMIPMYNYSMGLIYRTDLLGRDDLKAAYAAVAGGKALAPPATLADYVAVARFMRARAGVAGAAMQGQRGDPNSMEFSNYLFSAGGAYLDGNGRPALGGPPAETALRLYVDNIANAAQGGALSATLDDTMRLMCDGKAWSMVTYWWMLPQLDDPAKCPAVAGKLALGAMPGGHGESGGWGWGIANNQPDALKDAAWRFIAWVQGPEISRRRALEGHAPVRSDVFRDPAVLAKFPFYAAAEAVVASGRAFPIFARSAAFEDVLGREISLAATGETQIPDALQAANAGLGELMEESQ